MNNIYQQIEDAGFEFTGEFRIAKRGEYIMNGAGEAVQLNFEKSIGPVLILRKKRRTFEFDGQTFDCPEGFVFERVGCPRAGDEGKFIAGEMWRGYSLCKLTEHNLRNFAKITYFIFRKDAN